MAKTKPKAKTKTKAKRKPRTISLAKHKKALKAQRVRMKAIADERAKESFRQGFQDGNDEPPWNPAPGLQFNFRGYRSTTSTFRDESSTSQEAAIERAYRLFATHPLFKAISDIKAEYVWGDGPTIQADNEDVQKVLDAHWVDDVNNYPENGLTNTRDFSMYGEQVKEAFISSRTGRVRWGTVDPAEIDEIITDIENREHVIAIRTKSITLDDSGTTLPPRLLKVIATNESGQSEGVLEIDIPKNRLVEGGEVFQHLKRKWRAIESNRPTKKFESGWTNVRASECCYGRAWRVSEGHVEFDQRTGRKLPSRIFDDRKGKIVAGIPYDGQCCYFRANRTSIGLRGRPDLLALIDWLDRWDQLFFDFLEHAALLKDFVWDQKVIGGDEKEIQKFQDKFIASQAQAGKAYTHNENVELTAINPDLKAADFSSLILALLQLIAGGSRLAVFMLGSGEDSNLATATAQGSPIFKGFATRQSVIKRQLEKQLRFAIDSAVAAGMLNEKVPVEDKEVEGLNTGNSSDNLDAFIEKMNSGVTQESNLVFARDAFEIIMPEISPKETAASATVFASVANALVALRSSRLIDDATAVKFIVQAGEMLGVEINGDKLLEELEKLPAMTPEQGDELLDGLLSGGRDDDDVAALTDAIGEHVKTNGAASDSEAALRKIVSEGAREEPKGE